MMLADRFARVVLAVAVAVCRGGGWAANETTTWLDLSIVVMFSIKPLSAIFKELER